MRPRNKAERMVLEMSSRLHGISDEKKEWAFRLFPVKGFYLKSGKVWCQCCGHVDSVSKPELAVSVELESHVCPKCGNNIKITHLHDGEFYNEDRLVSFVETFEKWNVIRTFKASRINDEMGKETKYMIHEVYQNWINDDGKEVIVTRPYTRSIHHQSWKIHEAMTIGYHNHSANGYYVFDDMFDTEHNFFYPRAKVTDILKRNGWKNEFIKRGVPVAKAMIQLLTNPFAETLIKQGQFSVFKYMLKKGNYQLPYRYALNICHRNGYIINDASMWFDYMDLLHEFHLDTHNAHYVCPKNLKAEHDRLLKRKNREDERRDKLEKLRETQEWEKTYAQEKGRFFGICFGNEDIIITVVQSVAEMAEEGKAMHHCVYSMGYYKKKESLILSAKDKEGNRIETIELNLETFKIMQSRAVCNGTSIYHDKIIELVNRNIELFRRAAS